MTTQVTGTECIRVFMGSHLGNVNESLDYLKGGATTAFGSYTLDPNHPDDLMITDVPYKARINIKGNLDVKVNGIPIATPIVRYDLAEGSILVAKGPLVEGEQAELTVIYKNPHNTISEKIS